VPGALALGIAFVLAGCSSSSGSPTTTTGGSSSSTTSSSSSSTATGSTINVGAISTLSGSIASDFNGLAPGVEAYFNYINANGGVGGHKLSLAYNLDDGANPTQFNQLAHTLIDQDHAFAVMVASFFFSPNYFVETKTPTYGYNVSGNWANQPNLFAAGGSVQDYSTAIGTYAYFMKQTHSKSAAVISYGPSISSSYQACSTAASGLKAAGYTVSYEDYGAQLGGSYSSAVQKMQQNGSDFVLTCMQESDNITMARAIQQYGLKINQLWLNGYDRTLLNQYPSLMNGVYLNINGSVPYEAAGGRFGNTYLGMQTYINEMKKYEPSFTYNGVATQGWQSAALFVQGLKMLVQSNQALTQANLVNVTNTINDDNGAGTATVTKWTSAHTTAVPPFCTAFVQVKGSQFVPVFAPGTQVFTCRGNSTNPTPVTPPPGTPGA
jgi:ABC-type branched-subunit amino acid transport system substrate-binding protein